MGTPNTNMFLPSPSIRVTPTYPYWALNQMAFSRPLMPLLRQHGLTSHRTLMFLLLKPKGILVTRQGHHHGTTTLRRPVHNILLHCIAPSHKLLLSPCINKFRLRNSRLTSCRRHQILILDRQLTSQCNSQGWPIKGCQILPWRQTGSPNLQPVATVRVLAHLPGSRTCIHRNSPVLPSLPSSPPP